jgi:hypothetical protein
VVKFIVMYDVTSLVLLFNYILFFQFEICISLGFEALTAVGVKSSIFWDITRLIVR